MKKIVLIVFMIIPALVSAGCFKESVTLGQEFLLSPGKGAVIRGEYFEVTFLEVVEDSRCPEDVICVWEGRATSRVRIVSYNTDVEMELTQTGREGNGIMFRNYLINFDLQPYPVSTHETARNEYQLNLNIEKAN